MQIDGNSPITALSLLGLQDFLLDPDPPAMFLEQSIKIIFYCLAAVWGPRPKTRSNGPDGDQGPITSSGADVRALMARG